MRPYLAIIKDSFREAFASRVLWLMLLLITLFLLAVAPSSFQPDLATELRLEEIVNPFGLLSTIRDENETDEQSVGRHLWSLLPEDLKDRAAEWSAADARPEQLRRAMGRIRNELNTLIHKPDFWNADAWKSVRLDEPLEKLVERNDLTETELAARNRRLLEAAYPRHLALSSENVVYPWYFGWRIDLPLPISTEQQEQLVNTMLTVLISVLLGVFGVFVSILVTASFIPRTFEPGEITLLLSKPVSRSLLFLTKFAGGCAFTLLNVTYLLVGLWLIAGLRFDVWNHKLLLCIPVYLFLFSIYYAVSAGVGAIWRNAILSVCATIVFWFFLFLLGTTKASLDELYINPMRLTEIIPAGDELLAVNSKLDTLRWNADTRMWDEVFVATSGGGPPAFARRFAFAGSGFVPRYDKSKHRIVALEPVLARMNVSGSSRLLEGRRDEDWQRKPLGNAPEPVRSLLVDRNGRILLIGQNAIYDFKGQAESTTQMQEWLTKNLGGLMSFGGGRAFENIEPDEWRRLTDPIATALCAQTNDLAVYSAGRLSILTADESGKLTVSATRDFEQDPSAVVSLQADSVCMAFEDGDVVVLSRKLDTELSRHRPFDDVPPRQIAASIDGRFLTVLSHDRRAWHYDLEHQVAADWTIPGQGEVSAVTYSPENDLLIADRGTRVRRFDPSNGRIIGSYVAPIGMTETVYRYFLKPVYTVFPKPGELDNLISYLMTDQKTVAIGENAESAGLDQERITVDVWTPVWSNLAFLIVVLGATCAYISRRDF